jgi:hypothetical protein
VERVEESRAEICETGRLRRILYPLTAAAILAYFLFFTWKSLFLYFDQDDMYNLYMAWNKPAAQIVEANLLFWNGSFRPLGGIFYRDLFALAGFHPLPFHIVTLVLGVANMGLCFWFTRLVSRSDRVAALATLIFAFHTRLMEVWFRTAAIYDVLCFTFLYLAACLYIAARRDDREPEARHIGIRRIAAIIVCFILALDAKEMAVCLPVFLLAYELVFNTDGLKSFLRSRAVVLIGILAVITAAYAIGKLHGPDSMTTNPFYKLEYSYARFTETWSVYLEYLFALNSNPGGRVSMVILGALLGIALVSRSRALLFAWVVIFFGMLPVSFAPQRGGFVMFISWTGWALYAATVLVAVQDMLTRRTPQYRTALACIVFVLTGWRLGKMNLHDQRLGPRHWLYDGPVLVHEMADQMRALHRQLPANASMLFLEDSFNTDEWTPVFIVQLLYRDPGLTVDRIKMMTAKPPNWDGYQYVFTYEDGRYRQLKPS